jgi:hypothetical protein
MIFLSDGEGGVSDIDVQDLCLTAVRLGCVVFFQRELVTDLFQRMPLSFHTVSFGPDASSHTLRRMAELALEVQNSAPCDPLKPPTVSMPSSFSVALDSVRKYMLSSVFPNKSSLIC